MTLTGLIQCFQHHAPPHRRRVAHLCLTLLGVLLWGGCVTETTTPNRFPLDTMAVNPPPPDQPPVQRPSRQPSAPATPAAPIQPPVRSQATPPSVNLDPCATKLHDLCGPLLLYYKVYSRMPQTLEELKQFKEFESLGDFKCPASGLAYTYIPQGVRGPDEELLRENRPPVKILTYVIVADPTPVHGGLRFAISVIQQEGSEDFSLRVHILPE